MQRSPLLTLYPWKGGGGDRVLNLPLYLKKFKIIQWISLNMPQLMNKNFDSYKIPWLTQQSNNVVLHMYWTTKNFV